MDGIKHSLYWLQEYLQKYFADIEDRSNSGGSQDRFLPFRGTLPTPPSRPETPNHTSMELTSVYSGGSQAHVIPFRGTPPTPPSYARSVLETFEQTDLELTLVDTGLDTSHRSEDIFGNG